VCVLMMFCSYEDDSYSVIARDINYLGSRKAVGWKEDLTD